MPLAVETIGTGETYTTPALWEAALDNAHQHTGQCKAESFGAVDFDGVAYTSTEYPLLTSVDGAEHDGRAHEVSGAGNARIESSVDVSTVRLNDPFCRLSWMEIRGPIGRLQTSVISNPTDLPSVIYIHHNIIHDNNSSLASAQYGIQNQGADAGTYYIYRNIIYGTGDRGILTRTNALGKTLFNTVYEAHKNQGILAQGAGTEVANNAVFDCLGDQFSIVDGGYNCSSDTSAGDVGANNIVSKTASNNLINPTTTWADTDLRTIADTADIFETGDNSYSAVTYPEINVPVEDRTDTLTGAFSIGASQGVVVAAPEMTMTGNGQAIASGSSSPSAADGTDWEEQTIATEVLHTFTIGNTGDANLTMGDSPIVEIIGDAEFTLDTDANSPVAPAGDTTFKISYVPTAEEVNTATISIANNDDDENPYTFDIAGTGIIPPEMDITGKGNSIANGSSSPSVANDTDWGEVEEGSAVNHTFTIDNSGAEDLNLTDTPRVAISGDSEFTLNTDASTPIVGSGSTTFIITFTAGTPGELSATISIDNDDADENPYTFDIAGTSTPVPARKSTTTSTAATTIRRRRG